LTDEEINLLLDMRLIANLATIDDDGGIHLVPTWFRRDDDHILMPMSRYTLKYRNLSARPTPNPFKRPKPWRLDIGETAPEGRETRR
jgi:hypothetical protein